MTPLTVSTWTFPLGVRNVVGPFTRTFQGVDYTYYLGTVDFSVITTDSRTNRRLVKPRVREIASKFDPRSVRITVAIGDDGKVRLIGGQHCQGACAVHGYTDWECYIVVGCDQAQAAKLMEDANNVRRDKPVTTFLQRCDAKDEFSLSLLRAAKTHGYTFSPSAGPAVFCDVGQILKLASRNGVSCFEKAVSLLAMTWGEQKGATKAYVVCGIMTLLSNYETEDGGFPALGSLAQKLSSIDPNAITAAAHATHSETSRAVGRGMASAALFMAQEYNKKTRGNKKLQRKLT